MIDKFSVVDPGWSWVGWWWTGAGLAVILLAALVFWLISFATTTRDGTERLRDIAWVLFLIGVIGIPVGAGANAAISSVMRSTQIGEEKDRQIEKLGYLNYEGERNYQFTAVKDNEYIRGVMVEYPELSWQIMVLDMDVEKE